MIKIHNLANDYLSYLDSIKNDAKSIKREIWENTCYKKHPDVYNHVFELYDQINTSKDLHIEALKKYDTYNLKEKINYINDCFESRLDSIIHKYKGLGLDVSGTNDINIFIIVGNTSTNAIVTSFMDCSLFFFVESLPDGKYLDVLLSHELLHIIQEGTMSYQVSDPILKDVVFFEGLACVVSEIIVPNLSESEYINFKQYETSMMYESFIAQNLSTIRADFESTNWETIRNYVSNGEFSLDRVGYHIGYHVTKEMLKHKGLKELLDSNVDDNRSDFDMCFESYVRSILLSNM